MTHINALRASFPDPARDIRLNLESVMQPGALSSEQIWGVAVAAAVASRNARLRDAVVADALKHSHAAVVDDALAAAVLMGMNNVYYRFKHMVAHAIYQEKPARLRMNRLVKPATSKTNFELDCLAVSAINGCETCIRAHENACIKAGLVADQIHDAIRIAATLEAAALALEIGDLTNGDATTGKSVTAAAHQS